MTVHHDKLAYGKLASLEEEFLQERLLKMVEQIEGTDGEESAGKNKTGKKTDKNTADADNKQNK